MDIKENFAKFFKPLTHFLQKDAPFDFDSDCRKTFENLQQALTFTPLFICPNFEKPFMLTTNASNFTDGLMLPQGPMRKGLPIANL